MAAKSSSKSKRKNPWNILRNITVVLLISFAVALLTAGNLFFWTGNTVVKQDRYVAATAPIIKDSEVQKAMSLYTTNSIFNNIDVQQQLVNVLPPRADFLAPQLSSQLKGFTNTTLQKSLANPKFQEKWNQVQARQHDRLINFAANYSGDDKISINEIFNQLTSNLKDTKLSFLAGKQLPPKYGDITVVQASWLPIFHNVVTHIDAWRTIALSLLAVCLAIAIWLSRNRRRIIYMFSLFAGIFMFITLIALRAIRERVADNTDPQYSEGVRHALQIVFHSLVLQTVTILAAAIILGLIAWLSGNSRGAKAVKNQVSLLFSGKLHDSIFGSSSNKFVNWVQSNKRVLEWASVGVLTLLMLVVRLTLKSLLIYVLLLLISILAIEVVGGQPSQKRPVSR